jgi:hypothetical protein
MGGTMMSKQSLNPKDIIELVSRLKAETPEYPADMLAARKAAFLKQAATIKIQVDSQGGDGGQQGGSGTAASGGPAASGLLLQVVIGIGLIAALLLATFMVRDQISDLLQGNEVVTVEGSSTPSTLSTPSALATASPVSTMSPTEIIPTGTATSVDNTNLNGIPIIESASVVEGTPEGTNPNSGLHLGQTPGTPAAPGQGNPGNINQPDNPEKPAKPDKPDKPPKPPN